MVYYLAPHLPARLRRDAETILSWARRDGKPPSFNKSKPVITAQPVVSEHEASITARENTLIEQTLNALVPDYEQYWKFKDFPSCQEAANDGRKKHPSKIHRVLYLGEDMIGFKHPWVMYIPILDKNLD